MCSRIPTFRGAHLASCTSLRMPPPLLYQEFTAQWTLHITLQGCCRVFCNGTTQLAREGDAVLFPHGTCYAFFPCDEETRTVFLTFDGRAERTDSLLFHCAPHEDTLSLLRLLDAPALRADAKNHLLGALLAQLQHVPCTPFPTVSLDSLAGRILAEINRRYAEELTLADIADTLHITPSHAIHVFGPVFGVSPIQFLIQRRIGQAQYLLLTTDQSAGDIAGQVGILSRNHFYSSFKKCTGLSPNSYRAQFSARNSSE